MIFGYARISTQDQDLESQIDSLNEYGCEKVFSGKQSGKSDENFEKLSELIDYIRSGDKVVVTKFDRLGRSLNQVLQILQSITDKGATLVTLDGQVDTSDDSPMNKAMVHLLGLFAELEHSIIVDRLQSGRERTGKKGGRKKSTSPQQQDEIMEKLAVGESVSSLAREYGVSRQSIMRLRDSFPKLKGTTKNL